MAAPGATRAAERALSGHGGVGSSAAPGAADRSSTRNCACSSSTPPRWRARSGWARAPTPCCRPAFSRSPACCRATRRSATSRTHSRRPTRARAQSVVDKNFAAVDGTLARLSEVTVPAQVTSKIDMPALVPANAPDFVRTVTARIFAGLGDEIPVSADTGRRHLPVRHRGVRKAQCLRHRPGLARRSVRPMRPMQLRLPAQRDPGEIL